MTARGADPCHRVQLHLLFKSGGLCPYNDPQSVTVTEADGADNAPGCNHHHFRTTCGCTTYGLSPHGRSATRR